MKWFWFANGSFGTDGTDSKTMVIGGGTGCTGFYDITSACTDDYCT